MILSGVPANPTIFYRDINCLHEEIVKSNLAGCILTITPSSVRKIQTKSRKNDHLKRFLNLIDDFVELSPPTKTEMRSICFESGILNEKIIDTLVANSENYTILDKRVNRLRRQVRALVSS